MPMPRRPLAPGRRLARLGLRGRLPADQHDRADAKRDAGYGEGHRPLAEQDRDDHRNGDGADGGRRRHHRHGCDRQRVVEQRDADAAREPGDGAPDQIRLRGGCVGQHREQQRDYQQPAGLREEDDGKGTGAPAGEAAGKIGGPVEHRGADCQKVDQWTSLTVIVPPRCARRKSKAPESGRLSRLIPVRRPSSILNVVRLPCCRHTRAQEHPRDVPRSSAGPAISRQLSPLRRGRQRRCERLVTDRSSRSMYISARASCRRS